MEVLLELLLEVMDDGGNHQGMLDRKIAAIRMRCDGGTFERVVQIGSVARAMYQFVEVAGRLVRPKLARCALPA